MIEQSAAKTEERKVKILEGHAALAEAKRQALEEKLTNKALFLTTIDEEKRAMSTFRRADRESRMTAVASKSDLLSVQLRDKSVQRVESKDGRIEKVR